MTQDSDRPNVVLLCGLLCDAAIWAGVTAELSGRCRVRAVSFAGCSTISEMADRVLLEAPPRFVLIGHSMGGRVALELIRKAPTRVSALALLNTGVHPTGAHEQDSRGKLVALARESGMRALADAWLPPMMGASPARVAALMPDLIAMVERHTPDQFAGQQSALLERPDAAAALAGVRVPTLLMSGVNDTWSPLTQHEAMLQLAPHAELVPISDAGHMAPIEQPRAVAAAILDWITRSAAR